MGMLETIQSGRENRPPRIMIYGSEGVGKSTFGASAPSPIFIQTEDGLGELDCNKFPLAHSLLVIGLQLHFLDLQLIHFLKNTCIFLFCKSGCPRLPHLYPYLAVQLELLLSHIVIQGEKVGGFVR